ISPKIRRREARTLNCPLSTGESIDRILHCLKRQGQSMPRLPVPLLAISFVAIALLSSVVSAGTRVILAPYTAPDDPSSLYQDHYANPPPDQFYLKARFQRSWTGGAPFANETSYDPSAYTGLG